MRKEEEQGAAAAGRPSDAAKDGDRKEADRDEREERSSPAGGDRDRFEHALRQQMSKITGE